jgi:tartrate-resistant acid phosphatase type 5
MLQFVNNVAGRQLNTLRHTLNLRVLVPVLLLTILLVNSVSSSASSIFAAPDLAGSTVRFATIGDYGSNSSNELAVATLIKGWNPDFIITLGDNNYPSGAASSIDGNIGKYFHDYIYPYVGSFTPGSATNRFFPSLGNHDWETSGAVPYLNYFVLPNNERYYSFTQGPIEFFVMDSDSHEPDGISVTSAQAAWLHQRLSASTAVWKIVYFHHAPYSSGTTHGSNTTLQWPFQQWGASAVLSGHEHDYERILHDGIPYIVNGLGGESIYSFGTPVTGSQVRFNATYGAQLIEADANHITFQFYSIASGGTLIDSYTVNAGPTSPTNTPTITPTTAATSTPVPTIRPTNTLAFTATPLATNTPTPTATPCSKGKRPRCSRP